MLLPKALIPSEDVSKPTTLMLQLHSRQTQRYSPSWSLRARPRPCSKCAAGMVLPSSSSLQVLDGWQHPRQQTPHQAEDVGMEASGLRPSPSRWATRT